MDTNSRIALVTGGSRGIGQAIAQQLAHCGAKVAIVARDQQQLAATVEQIQSAGGQAHAITADLSQRSELPGVVAAVIEQFGTIDILVNNAGVGSSANPKPLVDFDDDFWDLSMAVNVTAPYLLTKLVLPGMLARGWGRIINISSINAKVANVDGVAYTASKHAIAGLTKAAALEVAGSGVTINAICPGVTESEMNDKRLQYDAERLGVSFAELEKTASPYGRRLTPDEIAPLAVFLSGDGAGAIHGQLINVCGGRVMV